MSQIYLVGNCGRLTSLSAVHSILFIQVCLHIGCSRTSGVPMRILRWCRRGRGR